jgi:hypothetical protein
LAEGGLFWRKGEHFLEQLVDNRGSFERLKRPSFSAAHHQISHPTNKIYQIKIEYGNVLLIDWKFQKYRSL